MSAAKGEVTACLCETNRCLPRSARAVSAISVGSSVMGVALDQAGVDDLLQFLA